MSTSRGPAAVHADWPVRLDTWTNNDGGPKWVAADESGTTGEDLFSDQPVMAHATVCIDDKAASDVLADLRRRARSTQAVEMKFRHFRRARPAEALAETLAADGPLAGLVNIVVAYKPYMAVGKIIDLLVEEWTYEHGVDLYEGGAARNMARTLFKDGPRGLGQTWEPLVSSFVSLARPAGDQRGRDDLSIFFERVEAAERRCHRRSLEPILSMLLESRKHAEKLIEIVDKDDGSLLKMLDPHVALLPDSIRYWYNALNGPFRFLHDENVVLSPQMVRQMLNALWVPHPSFARYAPRVRVALFATGTSHAHPSIQLADLAAGAGRVVISDFLSGAVSVAEALTEAVTPLITWGLLPDDTFWER